MKYITIAQFFRAKIEARKEILNWWKPEIGDLVENSNGGLKCLTKKSEIDFAKKLLENEDSYSVIPLLTTQQLIDFIEYRTGYGIDRIEYGVVDCYWVYPYFESSYDMDEEMPRWYREEMSFCDEELIQALWKCACEVATDSYYDK